MNKMEQSKIFPDKNFNDIVFEFRNKRYGSYVLRNLIKKNTFIALIICTTALLLFVGSIFIDFPFKAKKEEVPVFTQVEISLTEPPPLLENIPAATPPAAQKIESTDLVEMKVTDDDKVDETEKKSIDEKVDSTSEGTSKNGTDNKSVEYGDGSTIYLSVEQMPEYPGGPKGLTRYLTDNMKYPSEAKENGIQGTVLVVFVVNEDGSVSDVKLKKGIGGGCDQEAIRIVGQMRKWKPGKQGGVPVKVMQQLPIVFKLKTTM